MRGVQARLHGGLDSTALARPPVAFISTLQHGVIPALNNASGP